MPRFHPVLLPLCLLATPFCLLATPGPAQAMTMKECGLAYQSAQKAGSLEGLTWNQYRKSKCGDGTASDAASQAVVKVAAPAKPADAGSPQGGVTYPSVVDPKYAAQPASRARMHSCVDQYKANKATGANGGLKWIQKGGGYYSLCSKKLKGA